MAINHGGGSSSGLLASTAALGITVTVVAVGTGNKPNQPSTMLLPCRYLCMRDTAAEACPIAIHLHTHIRTVRTYQ